MDKLPKKNLDIQQIIDKIKDLPIDDKDKASILLEIKKNITNPSLGENKSLDEIENKYGNINMPRIQNQFNLKPISQGNENSNENINLNNQMQGINQSQPMTVAHFEILKNKLDSLQYELIDLLRHVKDYTQRYMNAIRQQDLDKINEYITGLFEVDKTLKETQALAAESEETEVEEEEPQDRKSVISKATSGIKNFFGSIGDNVSGITNLVTNTTKIANDMLSKKILSPSNSNTSNASITNTSNTSTNTTKTTNVNKLVNLNKITTDPLSKNKNVVSIEEYISDMNKLEGFNNKNYNTPIQSSEIISSNSNNINELSSNTPKIINNNLSEGKEASEASEASKASEASESKEVSENLEGALKKLNDEMNKDIDKTVNNIPMQSGGKRDILKANHKLTNKIKLLKLKLTKNKLQKQLSESKIIPSIKKNKKLTKNKRK